MTIAGVVFLGGTDATALAWGLGLGGFGNLSVEIPQQGGTVSVNSAVLDTNSITVGADNLWTGSYFWGIPIELGVETRDGYQLSHWLLEDGDGEQARMSGETVAIDVRDYTLVRPILEKAPTGN